MEGLTLIRTGQAPKKRARLLFLLMFGFIGVVCRLVYIQVIKHEHYDALAMRQSRSEVEVPGQRGRILDRQGRILAESYISESLWTDPKMVKWGEHFEEALATISEVTGVPTEKLVARCARRNRFQWLKRRLSTQEAEAIAPIIEDTPGLYFEREWSRFYSMGAMLSPIVGIVGTEHTGLTGLEQRYEKQLTGRDGKVVRVRDRKGNVLQERFLNVPAQGCDVQLSLDMSLQTILYQELLVGVAKSKPKAANAIVMDVHSGEILSMATWPAHTPGEKVKPGLHGLLPRMILDSFEPGSTMKPLIYAALLEAGMGTRTEMVHCGNGQQRFGARILNDVHGYGNLSLEDVIVKSSNIGAAIMGQRLGNERMYNLMGKLGFGQLNHLPLSGETRGQLRPLKKWDTYSTTSIPMGHEIGVNAIQMTRAYAALGNGGRVIQPSLEKAILSPDGRVLRRRSGLPMGQVFHETTCHQVLMALGEVVNRGTAKKARSELYSIGGKTGTTEKIMDGKYVKDKNIGSFVGIAPLSAPRLVVMVTMDEPTGVSYGGVVAAPVAKVVLDRSLQYLGIAPDLVQGRDS